MPDQPEIEAILLGSRDAYCRGDLPASMAEATRALTMVGDRVGLQCDDLRAWGWVALAAAEVEIGEYDAALDHLRRVFEVHPEDGEAMFFEARVHLMRWDIDRAHELFSRCQLPDVMRGSLAYYRAITADLQRRFDVADELYAVAEQLDPHLFQPVRMSEDDARGMLEDLVQSFPGDVRATLENATIEIVDVPDRKVDWTPHDGPLLLGLYIGVPIGDRELMPIGMPERVRIFKRNIERMASDHDELREQLRITLLHEVGHHLGWDEADLAERGLA